MIVATRVTTFYRDGALIGFKCAVGLFQVSGKNPRANAERQAIVTPGNRLAMQKELEATLNFSVPLTEISCKLRECNAGIGRICQSWRHKNNQNAFTARSSYRRY